MKLIKKHLLRGPNLYRRKPCLLAIIDLEDLDPASSQDVPGFTEALLALLPTLREHRCSLARPGGIVERLHTGTYMAHIVEHVMLELQCLAGNEVGFGRTRQVRGARGQYRLVCAYRCERVAEAALRLALDLVDALGHGRPFELATPLAALRDTAERCAIGTSTAAVLAAAARRGIPAVRLTEDANLFQLGWGSKMKRLQATVTGDTSSIAASIASDKQLTKTLLERAGVPVPEGATVTKVEEAQAAARRLHAAVTVKPLDANQGKGVTTVCTTAGEVAAAFEQARRYSRKVIVERYVEGRDYRVLVVGGAVAAASWRQPPQVTGDGSASVRALVEHENANPARGEGHSNILTRIPLDAQAEAVLLKQGYTTDSVLPAGVTVQLRGNANLSTGGTAEDVTDALPAETRMMCARAAAAVGLDVAGIDIICRDIAQPLGPQRGAVIEINAAPGIRMHQYPSRGKARDAGDAIAQAMFGASDGRIPVIAVTGTNGKTTTALLAAHIARLSGLNTGVTTTEGIYINEQRIVKGDCTGYWSARTVLDSPQVDIAVLETARGGILKRGLGFDRCDVSIVLNVSADHIGMDGVETLDELAQVKAVVARAASGAVVLNAEDRRCVAMAEQVDGGVEVLYFSLDAENPVLLRHLAGGGRALYLQGDSVVLADGTRHEALIDVRAMPVSLNGAARYNVANAMAAAAGLIGAGFDRRLAAAGLHSFVSNGKHNPLRSNVFDVGGVSVIVDYAHNCAAYAALADTANTLCRGRLVGVVSAAGDRRDSDLVEIGRTCASGFPELVVYEALNRGRARGETAGLLAEGARSAGNGTTIVHCELDVRQALRLALQRCQRGDMLVFACGSSMEDLIEAVRSTAPQAAERIAAEIA